MLKEDMKTGGSHDILEAVTKAREWVTSSENYGVDWPEMVAKQIPLAKFSKEQVKEMFDRGKLKVHRETTKIRSGCKGFPVAEEEKRRLRPIFEPLLNKSIKRHGLPIQEAKKRAIGIVSVFH